ncbi:MAG: WYL domain-containing protein [Gemmatimonadota bacterium]
MTPPIRRWIDLLAALLERRYPASQEELARKVTGYAGAKNPDAVRRMFERDKKALRSFGIPIETRDLDDDTKGYQLRTDQFYMPYLQLLKDGRKTPAHRTDRYGYRSLPSLTFEPDELAAVVLAARRVESLGIETLTEDARSAVRKLGHDLGPDSLAEEDGVRRLEPSARAETLIFDQLSDALSRRKQVTVTYHSIDRGHTSDRALHPYGLFFLGHHWYLAACAPGEQLVKNFRLSRIKDVTVSPAEPGTPDYEIPKVFALKAHAEARHAWELGSGDATEVIVRVTAATGAALAAGKLGEPVDGDPSARRFRVRRLDAFARWILGAGGAVVPLAPAELVAGYRSHVVGALANYSPEPR